MDRRIEASSTVMRALLRSVVVKRDSLVRLRSNPRLWSQIWVVTKRMRLWIQAAEMDFLQRVAGLSLRDKGRSSTIRRELGVEPLLVRIERSQLSGSDIRLGCLLLTSLWRIFGHVQVRGGLSRGLRADPEHTGGIV